MYLYNKSTEVESVDLGTDKPLQVKPGLSELPEVIDWVAKPFGDKPRGDYNNFIEMSTNNRVTVVDDEAAKAISEAAAKAKKAPKE